MELSERMKKYEAATRQQLTIRMPVIIRLDGRCFHTLTRGCIKPFDEPLRNALVNAACSVLDDCKAKLAYLQSDEVSFLLVDYNRFNSQQWFDGIVQKMASISASVMSVEFSKRFGQDAAFDARVFAIPERDVTNYFIWRQQDCMRNSLSMVAQSQFSHKELEGKNNKAKMNMLVTKGVSFTSYPDWARYGTLITENYYASAKLFHKNPEIIEAAIKPEEE